MKSEKYTQNELEKCVFNSYINLEKGGEVEGWETRNWLFETARRASWLSVRELSRKERDRPNLRGPLLAGAASAPAGRVELAYFERLRLRMLLIQDNTKLREFTPPRDAPLQTNAW